MPHTCDLFDKSDLWYEQKFQKIFSEEKVIRIEPVKHSLTVIYNK